jgi:hypothetical protein
MSADITVPVVAWQYASEDPYDAGQFLLTHDEPQRLYKSALVRRSDHAAAIASLQARLDAAERDAARIAALQLLLHWDGHAYWLPDLCIKEREYGNEYTTVPTLDELRAAIDAATQEQP